MNNRGMDQGYLSSEYAASLREFGTPIELPRSGGWVLEQQIPNTQLKDIRGLYPLLSCRDVSELSADVEAIGEERDLVSFRAVLDPLTLDGSEDLGKCQWDFFRHFKKHYVVELRQDPLAQVSSHHRRYARKALRNVEVSRSPAPIEELDTWVALYDVLTKRHGIDGIAAFSRSSFARQLSAPGIDVFRATLEGRVLGMVLWYRQGQNVYYHLGAYSEEGYAERASMAVFWRCIELFSEEGFRYMNLGGGAGVSVAEEDGLARFKRGWATGAREAVLIGRILDEGRYTSLLTKREAEEADFFPAYREGG